MSGYTRLPSPPSLESDDFYDVTEGTYGPSRVSRGVGPCDEGVNADVGDGEPGQKTCKQQDGVKEEMPTGATCNSNKDDGTVLAGPGETRRLIKFDVKAFFEDQPGIKTIGKDHDMSFRITGDAQIMRDILRAHGFTEKSFKTRFNNFSWIGNSISELCIDQLLCYQSINHFVNSSTLTRKDLLYKNISKMKKKKGAANFDFIPTSFVLPKEMRRFKLYYKKYPGPFIVKPAGLSRGRGVYLIGQPKDIVNVTDDQVVSKYIDNPLLIDGYKVDLRIYVLVTSFKPLVIYMYQEGLTRFATVKYKKDPSNLHALRMHLTNYSINVGSGNYIRNEDSTIEDFGSKWTLSALLRYFHENGIDTVVLMREIEDVIIKTILAAEVPIASGCRIYQRKPSNCFELFGFDIMLDENYKPWLLEVNLSPSLVCTTPLDIKVKANMLCDLLNLVGIECYSKEKPEDGNTWCDIFSSYIHRTVGYFCVCIIRDEIRQLISRHGKNKKINYIMGNYKEKSGASAEDLHAQEIRRAKYLSIMNSNEREMVYRVRNESNRSGGWVKIFPTIDSWKNYKDFMQYRTAKNVLLHQCLYPDQLLAKTVNKSNGARPTLYDEDLLKNTKPSKKSELGEGLTEMLQRLKKYMSSLEIGPPPQFNVKHNVRDTRPEENALEEDANRKFLLHQIDNGCLLTEVQARSAFLRYFISVKRTLRYCQNAPEMSACPPVKRVKDLLFQFLGQSSDLVIDPTKPPKEPTLESCLTHFLYSYYQETRELMAKEDTPIIETCGDNLDNKEKTREYISSQLFESFMHSANPWELENLLVSYLKIHGDASIFLRNRIQNKCPGSIRGQQQSNEEGQGDPEILYGLIDGSNSS